MDDSGKVQALKVLAEATRQRKRAAPLKSVASMRVSPGAYLAVASVLTFASVLFLRAEREPWALLSVAAAWLVIPALAFTDRIVFDGQSLSRRGVVPIIFQLISGRKRRLAVADFEKVETNAVRTLRRGGRVRYRYRSQVSGRGQSFALVSGGRSYRRMVQKLFPLIADERVDTRTRDLRDYLCEPASLSVAARELQLASPAVLDNAFSDLKKRLRGNRLSAPQQSADDLERARSLRQLANRLRVAGRLREAREAFRRALIVTPADAGLVYEFARLLRSQASAAGDARLLYRARAALRLAALRAGDDAALLAQIGESLIECGDTVRAERTLQRALNVDASNFRALVQLGDLALRNGKLAHVIHHYREAAHSAPDKVLAAYARREADYYARLNDDEDYLGSELRRISWLQNAGRVRRLAARITNASILVALVGPYVDQTVASIGWSLASSSLCGWLAALFVGKLLGERRNPDPTE